MNPSTPPRIHVRDLGKQFDTHRVLDGINLQVRPGSVVTVLGKSGSGKSVLLKCIAGLMTPDSGEVRFDGRRLEHGAGTVRTAFRRRCSYLFQNNALFDSLTARENIALPLEQTTALSRREIGDRTREVLKLLELESAAEATPARMSGGMQKRLALARALVTRPELVLFDEPTAGLDPIRRQAVFEMIRRSQREVGFTALIVTHDVPEALVFSDRVALLTAGRIGFEGSATDFFASAEPEVIAFRLTAAQRLAFPANSHSSEQPATLLS